MKIAVTGSSGLMGKHLVPALVKRGHELVLLVRRPPARAGEAEWNPDHPTPLPAANGCDALIHLAGANLASRRWTPERMALIRDSRVTGTRNLFRSLHALERPPRQLLCASAIGYYGDPGEAPVDEAAPSGEGFLAEVCRDWESAAREHAPEGCRVTALRFGMVLAPDGGALGSMLPFFRLGLGGPLGNGRFFMSWIDIEDVCSAMMHLLADPNAQGPFNLTAPHPLRNREFTRTLGRVLRRPACMPVPAFALRLLYGRMTDEVLLRGAHVRPARLLDSGFRFRYAHLDASLRHCLGGAR